MRLLSTYCQTTKLYKHCVHPSTFPKSICYHKVLTSSKISLEPSNPSQLPTSNICLNLGSHRFLPIITKSLPTGFPFLSVIYAPHHCQRDLPKMYTGSGWTTLRWWPMPLYIFSEYRWNVWLAPNWWNDTKLIACQFHDYATVMWSPILADWRERLC